MRLALEVFVYPTSLPPFNRVVSTPRQLPALLGMVREVARSAPRLAFVGLICVKHRMVCHAPHLLHSVIDLFVHQSTSSRHTLRLADSFNSRSHYVGIL